jgi:hypothetical protein
MRVFEYHLRIQRKSADFLNPGEVLDLLHRSHIRTLAPLFNVRGARGSAGKEDIVAEVKEGLLSPEGTVFSGLCHKVANRLMPKSVLTMHGTIRWLSDRLRCGTSAV